MIIRKGEGIRTLYGVERGLLYQMRKDKPQEEQEKVIVLEGDARLFMRACLWSRHYRAFPFLLSWKESPQEFREKLKQIAKQKGRKIETEEDYRRELRELWEEIKAILFAGYQPDEIVCFAVAHEDTDNFHIHVYVANNFAFTGAPVDLWYSHDDLRLIENYVNLKYSFATADKKELTPEKKAKLLKRLEELREENEEVVKEEIQDIIWEQVASGKIRNAEDVINFLKELGITVVSRWLNIVSIRLGDRSLRLHGEIFRPDWSFNEETKSQTLEELERKIEEYVQKREKKIKRKYKKFLPQVRGEDTELWKELEKKIKKEFELYDRLKKIPLPSLMEYLNLDFYYGISTQGEYILASVPWRKDEHPSLFAYKKDDGTWIWVDKARNEAGTNVDFVMRYFGYDFGDAINWLKENEKKILALKVEKKGRVKGSDTRKVEVRDVRPLDEDEDVRNTVMELWKLDYVPKWLKIGTLYKKVIRYKEQKDGEKAKEEHWRPHHIPVLVFEGDGFVFWRSILPEQEDKGVIGEVKPSLIRNGSQRVYVVEGLTDALAISQIDPTADILILHSVANVSKIPDLSTYREIIVATDNDPAGEEAYRKIKETYNKAKRLRFEGKDVMDFWLNKKAKKEGETNEKEHPPEPEIPSPSL